VKVLLVVIDGASPRVVCPAIQTGRLPNLKRIADAGSMHQASVTIFPSITPAATTSIVTGSYPAEHGIAGASWFDESRHEVAYYGDDFWTIAKKGFGAFLRDFLVRLNGDRLTAPTLFEMIERTGRRAACVNYLVYRGTTEHRVNVPWLMTLVPGVPITETVHGPAVLCLGDFVTSATRRGKVKDRGGPLHRFGMDDASSATMLCELAAARGLGDFTLAYFADNDYRSHEVGPHASLSVIQNVDSALGAMFDAAGGAERFLHETSVIVTSDHGHCEVLPDAARAVIYLDRVLGEFQQAALGRAWRPGAEIMICPNMRAAQVYVREPTGMMVDRVVRAALADRRVDLVLWQSRLTTRGADAYVVASQHGRLEFWREKSGRGQGHDAFGTQWGWRGERGALRLEVNGGALESAHYPNAFERIAGVLDAANSGEVWITAQPGCEFEVPGGKAHVGGASHGALHALESLCPVVLGGANAPALPRVMRSVDIAPLCMELLGLSMRYRMGEPRSARRVANPVRAPSRKNGS
jgi:Type I phosphodiesterase / nucleotide pyrophosphatase